MISSRQHYLALALILLAAIGLRTAGVASEGLWFDEGLSLVLTRLPAWDMILLPTDPTPPLYYLLHKAFIPTNASLLGVRSISIVCGVISVGLMYLLARITLGQVAGLIAASLLAVWTAHIDYSQEARCYSLLFMLTLAASVGVAAYARAETQKGRLWSLAALAMANVLSFYTQVTSVFWIAATSLLVLGVAVQRRRPLWEIAATFGLMAVFAAPGVRRLYLQLQSGFSLGWLDQAGVQSFVASLASVLLPAGFWDSPWIRAGKDLLRPAIALLSVAAVSDALWRSRVRMANSPALSLIVAYLLMPLLIWAAGFVVTPVYMARTVLFVIPGFVLLIAALCTMAPRPALAAAAVVAIYLVSSLLFGPMRDREDFRGAARFLQASAQPGDVIAVCSTGVYPALRYHVGEPTGSIVVGDPDAAGRLRRLEGPLGSDPAWDKHYGPRRRSPAALQIPAGRTVWVVQSHCKGERWADMNAVLGGLGDPGRQVWERTTRSGYSSVVVRRYVSRIPVSWPILR